MTSKRSLDLLNSFDPAVRSEALGKLIAETRLPPSGSNVNMHMHSFFSFNAHHASPTRLAWDARIEGLHAAGLCDFDVLDGLEEFLEAGHRLALRAAVGLETRAFFEEYAGSEINSPGEPGITYIMGTGFASALPAGSDASHGLQTLREQASRRNIELVARINERIPELTIDYRKDVLPLSPGNCPTERHIIRAYCRKAADRDDTIRCWTELLRKPTAEINTLLRNRAALEDAVRASLIKRGGLAYVAPTRDMFPRVDDFVQWVLKCRAMPTATWLDGESEGERDPETMLECLREKGVAAVNIVPDRNWNIEDSAQRERKVANLRKFVNAANAMDMPINIGTEMNKENQPYFDDLSGPVLREFADSFLFGARVVIGQTLLGRYADYAYCDPAVAADFSNTRRLRNEFFAAVGALPPLSAARSAILAAGTPATALDRIRESARKGQWTI